MVAAPLARSRSGFSIVMLAETCRISVDDPNTRTSSDDGPRGDGLDHSGRSSGSSSTPLAKLLVLGTLPAARARTDLHRQPLARLAALPVRAHRLAAIVGIVESVMARLQMRHVPYLLVGALSSAAFGFILLIR
jgi:hypothetical protein